MMKIFALLPSPAVARCCEIDQFGNSIGTNVHPDAWNQSAVFATLIKSTAGSSLCAQADLKERSGGGLKSQVESVTIL